MPFKIIAALLLSCACCWADPIVFQTWSLRVVDTCQPQKFHEGEAALCESSNIRFGCSFNCDLHLKDVSRTDYWGEPLSYFSLISVRHWTQPEFSPKRLTFHEDQEKAEISSLESFDRTVTKSFWEKFGEREALSVSFYEVEDDDGLPLFDIGCKRFVYGSAFNVGRSYYPDGYKSCLSLSVDELTEYNEKTAQDLQDTLNVLWRPVGLKEVLSPNCVSIQTPWLSCRLGQDGYGANLQMPKDVTFGFYLTSPNEGECMFAEIEEQRQTASFWVNGEVKDISVDQITAEFLESYVEQRFGEVVTSEWMEVQGKLCFRCVRKVKYEMANKPVFYHTAYAITPSSLVTVENNADSEEAAVAAFDQLAGVFNWQY